jgi:hypothetical protein
MSKKIITVGAGISVLAKSLRDHANVRAAFAADETARRQQVEKIVRAPLSLSTDRPHHCLDQRPQDPVYGTSDLEIGWGTSGRSRCSVVTAGPVAWD